MKITISPFTPERASIGRMTAASLHTWNGLFVAIPRTRCLSVSTRQPCRRRSLNSVWDSLLLLLIVSISVQPEKWKCCRQLQSRHPIDLLLPLPPRSYRIKIKGGGKACRMRGKAAVYDLPSFKRGVDVHGYSWYSVPQTAVNHTHSRDKYKCQCLGNVLYIRGVTRTTFLAWNIFAAFYFSLTYCASVISCLTQSI